MGVGAPANARDVIYDPFFGNNGELVTAAPDGRVYTPGATQTLTRQSGHITPSAAGTFTIDPGPQFNTDVDVTGVFLLSASLDNSRLYARYTTIASCYFADWNPTTGVFQVGYRDGSGPHIISQLNIGSRGATAGSSHSIRLHITGTSLVGFVDGDNTTAIITSDTRYTSGQVGFQLFHTDHYLDSFLCLRG